MRKRSKQRLRISFPKSHFLILPRHLELILRLLNPPAHPEEAGLKNKNEGVGTRKLHQHEGAPTKALHAYLCGGDIPKALRTYLCAEAPTHTTVRDGRETKARAQGTVGSPQGLSCTGQPHTA